MAQNDQSEVSFQQDNAPIHNSHNQKLVIISGIKVMVWSVFQPHPQPNRTDLGNLSSPSIQIWYTVCTDSYTFEWIETTMVLPSSGF